jgi:O-antigen/teichoic acid export membrane protein
MATTLVTSGCGFVYWWVAARRFSPASVGFAAAAISAMTLLGTFSMLGLGTLLIGELPRRPQQAGPLITTALLVAGTMGLTLGILAAVAAPTVSPGLRPLANNLASVLLFAVGVSLSAITLVLDQALIGLLRGQLQFARNGLFAVVKLVALILAGLGVASSFGMTIYATWILGAALSLVGLAGVVAFKGDRFQSIRREGVGPQWRLLRGIGQAALGHHALNLALQVPALIMPVVVTSVLSVTVTAYFYTTNMLTGFLNYFPFALSLSLYAVSAASPAALPRRMRFTLGLSVVVGVLANAGLIIGAYPMLRLFGAAYAEYAHASLRILGLSMFPVLIKDHYIAIARVRGRLVSAASLVVVGAALEVVLAGLCAHLGGLQGLCVGWLAAQCGEAAFMAPTVFRVAAEAISGPPQREGGIKMEDNHECDSRRAMAG